MEQGFPADCKGQNRDAISFGSISLTSLSRFTRPKNGSRAGHRSEENGLLLLSCGQGQFGHDRETRCRGWRRMRSGA